MASETAGKRDSHCKSVVVVVVVSLRQKQTNKLTGEVRVRFEIFIKCNFMSAICGWICYVAD